MEQTEHGCIYKLCNKLVGGPFEAVAGASAFGTCFTTPPLTIIEAVEYDSCDENQTEE